MTALTRQQEQGATTPEQAPLLDVRDLRVHFPTADGVVRSVDGVTFSVAKGETLSIVGESGSGKSVTAQAILGLHRRGRGVVSGQIMLDGTDLMTIDDESMRRIRGNHVAMVFQDPLSAFHPYYRIGSQIVEAIHSHRQISGESARTLAVEMLDMVGIPNPKARFDQYPHEFSGGMRQRAMIAMALVNEPKLLIADEPTTALDVTVQAQILSLMRDLQTELGTANIVITHDLGVVANIADRVMIMYAGKVAETGSVGEIFAAPEHPYTWGLLGSAPRLDLPRLERLAAIPGSPPSLINVPSGCSFHPRCAFRDDLLGCDSTVPELKASAGRHPVRCHLPGDRRLVLFADPADPGDSSGLSDPGGDPGDLGGDDGPGGAVGGGAGGSSIATLSITAPAEPGAAVDTTPLLRVTNLQKYYPQYTRKLLRRAAPPVRAVDGITFDVRSGETLGLVGESGCGKSTAGRAMLRLLEPTGGTVEFKGEDITRLDGRRLRRLRRHMQMVFQDPFGSLNSRQTVGAIIATPFKIQGISPEGGIRHAVRELMDRVGLNPEHYNRFPHEFSGGQRQRVGVARAIALKPDLIVCDEPVSALDASIQAQVINLLKDLQEESGVAYVFIAHDLSVVRHIADRIAVMYLGRVMEEAPWDVLCERPLHPYTHALLSAVPIPDPEHEARRERILLSRDLPSPQNPPSGCVFRTRCLEARERCAVEVPERRELQPGHFVACHFPHEAAAVLTGRP